MTLIRRVTSRATIRGRYQLAIESSKLESFSRVKISHRVQHHKQWLLTASSGTPYQRRCRLTNKLMRFALAVGHTLALSLCLRRAKISISLESSRKIVIPSSKETVSAESIFVYLTLGKVGVFMHERWRADIVFLCTSGVPQPQATKAGACTTFSTTHLER